MSEGSIGRVKVPVARLRKPSWKDPRLLIGLLLVLVSIAAVVALVSSADQTTGVYAARDNIAVGEQIGPEDIVPVQVRLGEAEDEYLSAADPMPENLHAQRLIESGELVARSALAPADSLERKPVGLTVDEALPAEAAAGSRVDVWVSRALDGGGYADPQLLLPGAEIAELAATSSALGSSTSTALHVLVTDEQMPHLLSALSNEARLAVVWNPGGGS